MGQGPLELRGRRRAASPSILPNGPSDRRTRTVAHHSPSNAGPRMVYGTGSYTKEYIEQQWSEEQLTQERVNESAGQTLGIANQYIDQVMANNDRVLTILEKNYSLIESDDIEIFKQFIVDLTRHKVEIDEAGRLQTPHEIYEHIGDISFMRTEFIETVDRRFQEKKTEVAKLVRKFI